MYRPEKYGATAALISFAFVLFASFSFAASASPQMELSAPGKELTVGQDTTVDLLLILPADAELPRSHSFVLTFDPAVLKLEEARELEIRGLSWGEKEFEPEKGILKAKVEILQEAAEALMGKGTIASIRFKALKEAPGTPLRLTFFDAKLGDIGFQELKLSLKSPPPQPKNYGFLAVLPPFVAVLLGLISKSVLLALFVGTFLGTLMLSGGNPINALTTLIKDYIFVQAADSYNSNLLVMMIFIGGFVGIVTRSGAASAFADSLARWVNTRTKAQLAVWLGGLAIFFSDSANPLVLGPTFQPITDKLRISREKLAWILDTTSSPVCILVPFIGWGIYIMGLIQKEFSALNIPISEFDAFIGAIPYQFYALGALFMVPMVALTGLDFSEMYKAERRTIETGQPFWPTARPPRMSISTDLAKGEGHPAPRASMMAVPLLVLFLCLFGLLMPLGFPFKRVPGAMLRTALCTGYFLGALSCAVLAYAYKVKGLRESFTSYLEGTKEVVFILLILVLAWSLGSVCKNLGTANYIVGLAKGTIPPWSIYVLIFAVGALISFATGSSWGTFAIMMPLAIPMAHSFGGSLYAAIGAVLSGGLFGDHCSPISDTTILSSMGAACDHIDHVRTQLPYALLVALASATGYLVAAQFESSFLLLGLTLGLTAAMTFIASKTIGQKVA